MSAPTDKAVPKQFEPYAFRPGQSGNPAGRPKGARNRFAERFVNDFMADWEEHGIAAIKKVREGKPDVYLRTAAAILPKQYDVNVDELDSLPDDEVDRRIAALEARKAEAARESRASGESTIVH